MENIPKIHNRGNINLVVSSKGGKIYQTINIIKDQKELIDKINDLESKLNKILSLLENQTTK
jgi:hypothetical protein